MAKPIPVAIVAAFLWIAMLIGLAVGVALLFPGTFLDRMWEYNRPAHAAFQTVGKTSGVGFLVLGLIPAQNIHVASLGYFVGEAGPWTVPEGIRLLQPVGLHCGPRLH
jgi:hypothetical protein